MWPKTALFLPVWPRDAKRLDTPDYRWFREWAGERRMRARTKKGTEVSVYFALSQLLAKAAGSKFSKSI